MLAATDRYLERNPGTTVSWAFRPLSAFNDQPLEDLASVGDLLVVDHPFAGTAARSGAVLAFDTVDNRRAREVREQSIGSAFVSYVSSGHVWALPVDLACQVAAWRPDLLEEPPSTWDDVVHLAERRPHSVALPLYPTDTICSLISLSGDSAVTLEAIEKLATLVPYLHPVSFTLNPPAVLDAMVRGNEIAYAPLLFGYSDYARRDLERRLEFAAAPTGRPTILGGAGVAVSASSAVRDAATDLAFWLGGSEGQRIVAHAGGQPAAQHAWDEAGRGPRGEFFVRTRQAAETAFVRQTTPGWPRFQELAGNLAAERLRAGTAPARIHAELERLALEGLP